MNFLKAVWEWIKVAVAVIYKFILQYPVAVILTIVIVLGAAFLMMFGHTIQIGGLLGKLWGKKSQLPDIKTTVPSDRKDEDGKPIPIGESDDKGWVQAPVTTDIKEPGLFSNPGVVTVVHPEKGEVKIPLPTGVKNSDIKEVVEIRPDVYEVKRNDKGVDTKEVLDILGVKK